jgi:hypothetical protein
MKKIYMFLFLMTAFSLNAQTTISYPQSPAHYNTIFIDGPGGGVGTYDAGPGFGMYAHNDGAKQVAAWRNFTEDATTTGTPSTMAVDDSFTITVSATQASYGVIGLSLLSSPTSTASWADRINNYAVQVNLNGNVGANDPWEVVSNGGTIDASSIGGSTSFTDFKFKFTLTTATTMTVSINDGAETFNVTLNNQDITGYSVYLADDWNGSANADIIWKPTTEYIYAMTLDNNEFKSEGLISAYPNPTFTNFQINHSVNDLKIFDITGKLVKSFNGNLSKGFLFDISSLKQGLYLMKIKNDSEQSLTSKLVKL